MLRQPEQEEVSPENLQELAALILGVTRTHLSLVLNGHRQSVPLKARYDELMKRVVSHTLTKEEMEVCRNFLITKLAARILQVLGIAESPVSAVEFQVANY